MSQSPQDPGTPQTLWALLTTEAPGTPEGIPCATAVEMPCSLLRPHPAGTSGHTAGQPGLCQGEGARRLWGLLAALESAEAGAAEVSHVAEETSGAV